MKARSPRRRNAPDAVPGAAGSHQPLGGITLLDQHPYGEIPFSSFSPSAPFPRSLTSSASGDPHHAGSKATVPSGNQDGYPRNPAGLVSIHEAPPWLRFNKFILGGYRPMLDVLGTVKSLGQIHNETFNVWSHLLPALCCLLLCAFPPEELSSPLSRVSIISFATIFTCSAIYHLFMPCCRSATGYRRLLSCDVIGSLFCMTASAYSFVLHGNRCLPPWVGYLGAIVITLYSFLLLYIIPLVPKMSVIGRLAVFGTLCSIRLGLCWITTYPKWRDYGLGNSTFYHSQGFVALLFGGLINASRVPERFFPKTRIFDYVFNSHNIWHYWCVHACACTLVGSYYDYLEYDTMICGN